MSLTVLSILTLVFKLFKQKSKPAILLCRKKFSCPEKTRCVNLLSKMQTFQNHYAFLLHAGPHALLFLATSSGKISLVGKGSLDCLQETKDVLLKIQARHLDLKYSNPNSSRNNALFTNDPLAFHVWLFFSFSFLDTSLCNHEPKHLLWDKQ